jgi:hypothetical protein
MPLSRMLAVLACTLAVAVAAVAPAIGSTAATSRFADTPAVAAKSCSAGYTHAVMPDGAHKCLRVGQFCSRKLAWQRTSHRYGFHCKLNRHLRYY